MNKLAIFDLDGTLFDTPRAIVETFSAAFKKLGFNAIQADDIRATIGIPLELAFSKLMSIPKEDELVLAAVNQYQMFYKEIILPKARDLLFPDVETGLNIIREHDFHCAIVTNKFYQSAHALLVAAGVRDNFEMLLGADQVTNPKPHPEAGLTVLQKFNVSPESAWMVGDTTHDIQMAQAADIPTIAVTYGIHNTAQLESSKPTWVVNSFLEVVNIITRN